MQIGNNKPSHKLVYSRQFWVANCKLEWRVGSLWTDSIKIRSARGMICLIQENTVKATWAIGLAEKNPRLAKPGCTRLHKFSSRLWNLPPKCRIKSQVLAQMSQLAFLMKFAKALMLPATIATLCNSPIVFAFNATIASYSWNDIKKELKCYNTGCQVPNQQITKYFFK